MILAESKKAPLFQVFVSGGFGDDAKRPVDRAYTGLPAADRLRENVPNLG